MKRAEKKARLGVHYRVIAPTLRRPVTLPGRSMSATSTCLLCALLTLATPASEGGGIPDVIPPFLAEGVAPNLVLTVDDSRSMSWAFFGEYDAVEQGLSGQTKWLASPDANPLYYNPRHTYAPAVEQDGNPLPVESDLTKVLAYPFTGGASCSDRYVNLETAYQALFADDPSAAPNCRTPLPGTPIRAPYYYEFLPSAGYRVEETEAGIQHVACSTDPLHSDYHADCVRCGDVHSPPDHQTPDLCFSVAQDVEDLANFATWFKFYRTRLQTTKTVLSQVLQTLDEDVRITYQGLEDAGSTEPLGFVPGEPEFDQLTSRFGPFSERKAAIYDWLFAIVPVTDSWLVAAHIRAGEFVSQGIALADDTGTHSDASPGSATDPTPNNMCGAKCRDNFHLLVADGLWEDYWGNPSAGDPTSPRWPIGSGDNDTWIAVNWDGSSVDLPTTLDSPFGDIDYTPRGPFKDDNTGMLADAAFYYWARDLRPDLANEVKPLIAEIEVGSDTYDEVNFWNPANDPADWQHLTLFTVAYGISTAITVEDGPPYGTWTTTNEFGETRSHSLEEEGFPSCVGPPYEFTENAAECDLAVSGSREAADAIPTEAKADDLYHAALNARGRYYRASAPDALAQSFSEVLNRVSAAAASETSNASVAIKTGKLSDDSRVFQAVTNSETWTGEVRSLRLSRGFGKGHCPDKPRGAFCERGNAPYQSTKVAGSFPAGNARRVFTMADGTATLFDSASLWPLLSKEQKLALMGCPPYGDLGTVACQEPEALASNNESRALAESRIDWLRGEYDPVSGMRERTNLLGDILGSGPVVVGPPRQLFEDADYRDFKSDPKNQGRPTMVYVGANDGMLHAFNADVGKGPLIETFAYVPQAVYANLAPLTDPAYGGSDAPKQALVDGAISYSDAKFTDRYGKGGWRSVLVGALGMGAQSVYALDITDPGSTAPTDIVLWEFSDASGSDGDDGARDGRDMGYTLSAPPIVRIDPGSDDATEPVWVALVGNGYGNNSTEGEDPAACADNDDPLPTNCTISQTGNAVLYVLNLGGDDENRIHARMDTAVGAAEDPADLGRANGLAEVSALDENGDLIADRAYAGDLFGNLWRFDLTDSNKRPTLIFQARDEHGNPQPITSRITFTRHPKGGYLLLFGTGRFLDTEDKTDLGVQTFYGIWDDGGRVHPGPDGGFLVPSRADLVEHAFLQQVDVVGEDGTAVASRARTSTTSPIATPAGAARGWMIDLMLQDGTPEGERVVVAPQVRQGRVLFVSMIPGGCCESGGSSWINALDAIDGGRLTVTPFDFNLDGEFNNRDLLKMGDSNREIGSSIRVIADNESGIYAAPARLDLGNGDVALIVPDSEGDLHQVQQNEALRWRTWLQLE
jgi:type IV pilus assembly protein PilY1